MVVPVAMVMGVIVAVAMPVSVVVSVVMGCTHARVLLRPIIGAAPLRQMARWFTRFDSSAALSRRSL